MDRAATTIATGGDINDIGNAALFGAISGLASAGVGSAFSGTGAILGGNAAAQAGAHGLVQGSLSAIQGGDFGTGFVSGALSSGVATGLEDFGALAQIGGAGLTGGISAEISGGKFSDGFTRGITVAALNHLLHRGAKGLLPENKGKKLSDALIEADIDPNGLPEASASTAENMVEQVDILKKEYIKGGKPKFDQKIYSIKSGDAGVYRAGKIYLTGKAFTSNLKLAFTIGHELQHAIHHVSGKYFEWRRRSNNFKAREYSEYKAYGWELKLGSLDPQVKNQYGDYYNQIKAYIPRFRRYGIE